MSNNWKPIAELKTNSPVLLRKGGVMFVGTFSHQGPTGTTHFRLTTSPTTRVATEFCLIPEEDSNQEPSNSRINKFEGEGRDPTGYSGFFDNDSDQ